LVVGEAAGDTGAHFAGRDDGDFGCHAGSIVIVGTFRKYVSAGPVLTTLQNSGNVSQWRGLHGRSAPMGDVFGAIGAGRRFVTGGPFPTDAGKLGRQKTRAVTARGRNSCVKRY
jgi:hypothetical protein